MINYIIGYLCDRILFTSLSEESMELGEMQEWNGVYLVSPETFSHIYQGFILWDGIRIGFPIIIETNNPIDKGWRRFRDDSDEQKKFSRNEDSFG